MEPVLHGHHSVMSVKKRHHGVQSINTAACSSVSQVTR
jgi:hypothetical protein